MTVDRTLRARLALRRGLRRDVATYPHLTTPEARERASTWINEGADTMTEKTKQTGTRLPESLIARIDAYTERLQAELPGATFTRADAIRTLLTQALDANEVKA